MPDSSKVMLREILSDSDLFYGLSEADIDALASIGVVRRVGKGETVFVAGQEGHQLFAVVSGQVKIVATDEEGQEMTLRLIDSGEIFGELALLDGGERSATAISTRASELFVVERRDFLDLLRRQPDLTIELLAVVARRLRSTTEQATDTHFLDIARRLAKKLIELTESYPEVSEEGRVLRISQEELGNLVAATRVSVNMQLKDWEREGLVRTARGRVLIADLESLRRRATSE